MRENQKHLLAPQCSRQGREGPGETEESLQYHQVSKPHDRDDGRAQELSEEVTFLLKLKGWEETFHIHVHVPCPQSPALLGIQWVLNVSLRTALTTLRTRGWTRQQAELTVTYLATGVFPVTFFRAGDPFAPSHWLQQQTDSILSVTTAQWRCTGVCTSSKTDDDDDPLLYPWYIGSRQERSSLERGPSESCGCSCHQSLMNSVLTSQRNSKQASKHK